MDSFCLHWNKASESPKHCGDEKKLEKTLHIYVTSNLHAALTERENGYFKKPYVIEFDIQLHAMSSFYI